MRFVMMLQISDLGIGECLLLATRSAKTALKTGQSRFGTELAMFLVRQTYWRTHMKYQPLSTQSLWDEKAKKESKIVRRQQAKESAKSFFLFLTCMGLMGFAFWCYWTHQTWLPETITQFSSYLNDAPEKIVNTSVNSSALNGLKNL